MPKKSQLLGGLAGVMLVTGSAVVANIANASEQSEPALRLVAVTSTITHDRYSEEKGIFLDLGTHIIAGATPWEISVARESYAHPVIATQAIHENGTKTTRVLSGNLITDLGGLHKFLHLTITDSAGKTVVDRDETFCPNGGAVTRTRPDAPPTSPYPPLCSYMPFSLASVWGLQAGWGVPTGYATTEPIPTAALPDGTYNATVSINKPHRDAFEVPEDKATATVKLVVRTVKEPSGSPKSAAARHDHHAAGAHSLDSDGLRETRPKGHALAPAANHPAGADSVPAVGPRPDLRALPAWQIKLGPMPDGPSGGSGVSGREYLSFSANVWNAGTSPLVVDGFRRSGTDLMDAYQYFYDADGKQIGWAPSGTMEWDPREGHDHWHFTDFATYRLLDASREVAVRSDKEAFCLLPTDPVDLTLPGANWKPASTNLGTACGNRTAVAVRQALDIGWGDTYSQYLPGQSFDVTDLPNGTYYIEVKANPERRLHELDLTNNTSLRQVIIGGTPGARTVTVPPYELIDAP